MTKQDAIAIFGTAANLARALKVHRSAISQWPDELTTRQRDQVIGAAIRLQQPIPTRFLVQACP